MDFLNSHGFKHGFNPFQDGWVSREPSGRFKKKHELLLVVNENAEFKKELMRNLGLFQLPHSEQLLKVNTFLYPMKQEFQRRTTHAPGKGSSGRSDGSPCP